MELGSLNGRDDGDCNGVKLEKIPQIFAMQGAYSFGTISVHRAQHILIHRIHSQIKENLHNPNISHAIWRSILTTVIFLQLLLSAMCTLTVDFTLCGQTNLYHKLIVIPLQSIQDIGCGISLVYSTGRELGFGDICGTNVRNHTSEGYKLYFSRCDTHRKFMTPKTHTLLDIPRVFHRHGFSLLTHGNQNNTHIMVNIIQLSIYLCMINRYL